jgi:tetratricopeptide (TPR) repeat protein
VDRALLTAAVAAVLLASCARRLPGGLACPDHGGAPWHEYRSNHFLVLSDLEHEEVAPLVAELERTRALVLAALRGAGWQVPGRLRVVAPARERMFLTLAPPGVLGYYLVSGLGEPTIVLHAASTLRDPEVLAHEMVHYFSWHLYTRQPPWFTEGLAQFVQTVASPDPSLRGWAGRVPRIRRTRCASAPRVSGRDLLTWAGSLTAEQNAVHSLWSWVLYHWLWSERSTDLHAFQRRLASGEEPVAAWAATFPDLDPATGELPSLDAALIRHCKLRDLLEERAPTDTGAPATFTTAPLSSAEVHVLMVESRGYWTTGRYPPPADYTEEFLAEAARPDLKEALREDGAEPRALSRLADLDGTPAVPPLQGASRARPGDWSVWYLLGDALEDAEDEPAAEDAYRKAAALNPDNAPTQNNLAWLLGRAGRPEEALPFAERAAGLAPWDPSVLDTLALVRDRLGACPEALRLQRQAVALLRSRGTAAVTKGENAQELSERLAEYEARCGGARSSDR